jgi:hypothetical protein
MEKGMLPSVNEDVSRLVYFFRPPDFCLGGQESLKHTPKSWTHDQKAERYEQMTILWAELKQMFTTDPWGGGGSQWL